MIKQTKGEKVFSVFNYIFLSIICFTMLYPLLYTFSMSVSTKYAADMPGFHVLPMWGQTTWDPFRLLFKNQEIWRAYGMTIARTLVGTVLAVFVTIFYGYALSRPNLIWKKFFTTFIVITMLFNGGQIPNYLNIRSLGLIDSFWVYVLPLLISAYNVVVSKSFFAGIPESLNESAKIDGAGEFRTFFQIIMPLSKPIIMTLALWIAVAHWNSWMDSLLYINDNKKIVVQLYLQRIINEGATNKVTDLGATEESKQNLTADTVKSAAIMVTVIPILCFYPFVQKYFIKGVTLGAVKG